MALQKAALHQLGHARSPQPLEPTLQIQCTYSISRRVWRCPTSLRSQSCRKASATNQYLQKLYAKEHADSADCGIGNDCAQRFFWGRNVSPGFKQNGKTREFSFPRLIPLIQTEKAYPSGVHSSPSSRRTNGTALIDWTDCHALLSFTHYISGKA